MSQSFRSMSGAIDQTADLNTALDFVIRRIEEEASRSGEPLTDEQLTLLKNLPVDSTFRGQVMEPETPLILPRDLAFERLCALAKAAQTRDLQLARRTAVGNSPRP